MRKGYKCIAPVSVHSGIPNAGHDYVTGTNLDLLAPSLTVATNEDLSAISKENK